MQAHASGDADGQPVDWEAAVRDTPENVNEWMVWIHSSRSPEVAGFLQAVRGSFPEVTICVLEPRQLATWKAYVRTRLPCSLMDIVMDRDMLSDDSQNVGLLHLLLRFHAPLELSFNRTFIGSPTSL